MLWYALAFLDFNCFCSGVNGRLFTAFAFASALAFVSGLLPLSCSPVACVWVAAAFALTLAFGAGRLLLLDSPVAGVLVAAAFAFALALAFGSRFALAFGADLALAFAFAVDAGSTAFDLSFGFLPRRLLSGGPKRAPAVTHCSHSGGGPRTLD